MKNTKTLKAYTFVELLVVITIIAILGAIGFMSYNSYVSKSRDTSRVSQAMEIYKAMETYKTKAYLPIPEQKVAIYTNGIHIGYQGYATENILNLIGFKEGGKDPKDKKYFTYFLNTKLRKIGVLALLENNDDDEEDADRQPKVYGDKVGVILDINNVPIQEQEKLLVSGLEIGTTTDTYKIYFNQKDKISGTGDLLQVMYGTAATGIIGSSCSSYIEANQGYMLNPGYYLVKDNNTLKKVYCTMSNSCLGVIPTNGEPNATTSSGTAWVYSPIGGECTFKCEGGYDWDGDSCELSACGGTFPMFGAIANNTSSVGSWNYNPIAGACTFTCDSGYTRSLGNCTVTYHTVTFNGNGGAGHTPLTKSIAYNTAVGVLPTNPTRVGHTFNGWYTLASGGTQITAATIINSNITYFAQWTPINYTVTFNGNGGAGHTPLTKSVAYNTAVGVLPTNPTRFGYTFNGWYTLASGGTQITAATIINGNTTYYAHWTPINYTVTFNGNGGAGHTPPTKSVAYNTAIGTLPTNPTRVGYGFNGWYTLSSGGTQINGLTVITGDTTYYAQWTIGSYTVTFDGNGGTGHTPPTKSVAYNTAVGTLPTNPIRAGYIFNGWYTLASGGTQVTVSNVITTDITYYAQWSVGSCIFDTGIFNSCILP